MNVLEQPADGPMKALDKIFVAALTAADICAIRHFSSFYSSTVVMVANKMLFENCEISVPIQPDTAAEVAVKSTQHRNYHRREEGAKGARDSFHRLLLDGVTRVQDRKGLLLAVGKPCMLAPVMTKGKWEIEWA